MIAQLIPIDGSPPVTITRDVTIVGRKAGVCDLVIDHPSVSKAHCAIAKTDGLLFFRDMGSTNGTKVNGQRATRGALLPGDELAFAAVKYRVFLGPGDPDVLPEAKTEALNGLSKPDGDQDDSNSDVRLLDDSHFDLVS